MYLALQLPVKKQVALKMISGLTLDEDARKRFDREATSISGLYHPNIVSLVDYGTDKVTGAPFMALEYVRGGRELSQLMDERRNQGEAWKNEELINIFTQILNGLSVAHRSGLVHRDIKPPNIMLVRVEGNPHFVNILDFGLVKALEEVPGIETLTAKGAVIGTPQYMAPEQIASKGEVDLRCDLYAVAAIFFEMVTGQACCTGKSTKEIFFEKLNPDFNPMETLPQGILSPSIESFLKKAMAREPSKRFTSALEMKKALVEILGGRPESYADEEDAISYAKTISADSRKILEEKDGSPSAVSVTRDAGSIRADASRCEVKKKRGIRWSIAAVGLAAALIIGFMFTPWSPFFKKSKNDVPKPSLAGDQTKIEMEPVEPEPEALKPAAEKIEEEEVDESGTISKVPVKTKSKTKPAKKVLPAQPSQEELKVEVEKLKSRIRQCVGDKKGSLEGAVYILGKTGMGKNYFMKGDLNTNDTRKCLGEAMQEVKVQPFSDLKYPMKFSITIGGDPDSPKAKIKSSGKKRD